MSQPQHLVALAKANRMRLAKAAVRQRVRAPKNAADSSLVLASELEKRPECLVNIHIGEIIDWRYKTPHRSGVSLLRHVGASPTRKLGDLTDRQLELLCMALRSTVVRRTAA